MSRLKCQMAAFSVAMGAKAGRLEALDVDVLEEQAEQLLEPGDPLRRAISDFATQFPVVVCEPPRLAEEGARLARAVELSARPDAPDAGRLDIHG